MRAARRLPTLLNSGVDKSPLLFSPRPSEFTRSQKASRARETSTQHHLFDRANIVDTVLSGARPDTDEETARPNSFECQIIKSIPSGNSRPGLPI